MDPLIEKIENIKNKQIVMYWLSDFLRFEFKLDKYSSTCIKEFIASTFEKSEQLDQRRLLINLFPYTGDQTKVLLRKLIKIIQLSNLNKWSTLKLTKLAGLSNQTIYNHLAAKNELLCFYRERGGDCAHFLFFDNCNYKLGDQILNGKMIHIANTNS